MKIILNGDDYGLRPSIDRSMIELIESGLMTGAGIMTLRGISDLSPVLRLLDKRGLCFSPGLHLDLDDFFLFDETGRYGSSDRDLPEGWEDTLNSRRDEIAGSIISQIDFLKRQGVPAIYLDGHHNVHLIMPVLQIILPLMKEHNISRMRFVPGFYSNPDDLSAARALLAENKIITSDTFVDLADIMSGRVNINPADPGIVEIMCHTDAEDNTMGRADQHHFLTRDNFKGFEIISWSDIDASRQPPKSPGGGLEDTL